MRPVHASIILSSEGFNFCIIIVVFGVRRDRAEHKFLVRDMF